MAERVVSFRVRTVLAVFALAIAVWSLLHLVSVARHVLVWIVISLFLALAINPLVEWLQRRGLHRRGVATTVAFLLVLLGVAAVGALFIPTLVDNVNKFVDALPGYVDDLTKGKGRFGFLETKYHVAERVRRAVASGGTSGLLGLTGTALAITKGILTAIVATVTITFMTFFMLLEGPVWMDRFYNLLPEQSRDRWRGIGHQIYRTVGGYVTGNLLISIVAGVASTVVLLALGVPYAVALGLLVAILDLIPLAGATIAAIIVVTVGVIHSITAGIILVVFFVVYQQLENHVIQPIVYSRTVQLSPLAILISVLIGAQLAGVLGALAAIPIAGTLQVLFTAWLDERRKRPTQAATL